MDPLLEDPKMESLVETYGELELEPTENPYERLVISVANQQLSTESAGAIVERLLQNFDVTPGSMLEAEESELREIGFSSSKIRYIKNAAEAFRKRDFTREGMNELTDEEVIGQLTDIKGIGPWTAKMYLMFVLGRKDIFPVEDLGIRKGFELVYGEATRSEMIQKAKDWSPLRSIASLYLWKVKRNEKSLS
jgi:DNA-3-methyladenine glycosylase II